MKFDKHIPIPTSRARTISKYDGMAVGDSIEVSADKLNSIGCSLRNWAAHRGNGAKFVQRRDGAKGRIWRVA